MNRLLGHHLANPKLYDLPIEYKYFSEAVGKVLEQENKDEYDRVLYEQSNLLHFMDQTMLPLAAIRKRIRENEGKRPLLEPMSKVNNAEGRKAKAALERLSRIIDDETECYDRSDLEMDDAEANDLGHL